MWCESFLFTLWDRYFESASTLAPILRVLIKCLGHMSEGGGGQMAEGSPNIWVHMELSEPRANDHPSETISILK